MYSDKKKAVRRNDVSGANIGAKCGYKIEKS